MADELRDVIEEEFDLAGLTGDVSAIEGSLRDGAAEAEDEQAAEPDAEDETAAEDETVAESIENADREIEAREKHKAEDFDDPQMKELLEPYREELEAAGVAPRDAVKRLFDAERLLRDDPAAGMEWLSKSYAQNLSVEQKTAIAQKVVTALGLMDPSVIRDAELDEKIGRRFEQQAQQRAQHEHAQRVQAEGQRVDQFFADKSDRADVEPVMAKLAAAERDRGREIPSLDVLYRSAKAALHARDHDPQQRAAEQKAHVEKAKAARTPKSTGAPPARSEEHGGSIEQILREEFAKAEGRR